MSHIIEFIQNNLKNYIINILKNGIWVSQNNNIIVHINEKIVYSNIIMDDVDVINNQSENKKNFGILS